MKYTNRLLIVVLLALGMPGMSSPRPAYAASTITVSSCGDAANLEAAIAQANTDNAGDTITFSCSGDITFSLPTTLNITGNMTLDGSGQTVSLHEPVYSAGGETSPVFRVNTGGSLTLNHLTVAACPVGNGGVDPTCGGGIINSGTLNITNSTFSDNAVFYYSQAQDGGAIINSGTVSITNSTISGNDGGGILNAGTGTATVTNSTFSNNGISRFGGVRFGLPTINYGGGIANAGSGTVTVTDSTFSGNSTLGGGAISNAGTGAVTVTNGTFSGNSTGDTQGQGGAISNHIPGQPGSAGPLTVTNSTFSGNNGTDSGGIYNSGTLKVTNSTFSGNGGGAIHNEVGTATVTNSTFSGNGGGAIRNSAGTLSITNSTLRNNTGTTGGGIDNFNGTLTVTNNTFTGNGATGAGGGIHNGAGTGRVTVTNSTFSGNSGGGFGGGIANYAAMTVTNSTFSGNSATNGGGIYDDGATSGTLFLANSIMANSPSGGNCHVGNVQFVDIGGNVDDGTTCIRSGSGSLANTNPRLGPLADNGGPTQTMALGAGSPAINYVLKCTRAGTTDQRGSTRPDNSGAGCDSGAYEFTVAPPAPAPQAATTAWAIGPNQAIQYYDVTSARWQKIDGLAVRIALGAAGQPYVVNAGGLIYRRAKGANGYVDGSWQQLPGTATDIGAGADGSVWTIGTAANPGGDANGHPILYFDASTASFKPVDGSATSIAVAPDGQPWVVNASGQIYRRTRGATGYVDGAWQTVTGTARDIGVGSDGSVWTIGTNQLDGGFGISRYDATSGTWQAIGGAAVRIAVDGQGAPWVVNAGGQVWRYTASGGWASYGSANTATDVGGQ